MLIVGDRAQGMGDVKSVLKDVGRATLTAAKQTGAAAVQGAGQSLGARLQSLLPRASGGRKPGMQDVSSYLPWILGGAAAIGVGYMVLGRRR